MMTLTVKSRAFSQLNSSRFRFFSKRVNKRACKKCSTLLWLLLLVPLITAAQTPPALPELIYDSSEHFSDIDSANLDGLLQRIADARLVLLGEASHGTAEFYDMRARITRELIENKGFNIVALEADWPDASSIDYFIRGTDNRPAFRIEPFSGYPSWMWANHSVLGFIRWLKAYNQRFNTPEDAVALYGLDLYNLYSSIEAVLAYLYRIDPKAAEAANWSYGCLKPWANDPSLYSRAMQTGRHPGCEHEVKTVLQALRKNHAFYKQAGSQQYFNAEQNARITKNGERYFRTLYNKKNTSWNQRDQNMFETLQAILNDRGPTSKAVIWAHNSHLGDARATDMKDRGDFNLGQRVRETFADSSYLVGFGTDHGTVAAAADWGEPMQVMQIPPAREDSYEYVFHQVNTDNFLLPLRKPLKQELRERLLPERLQRAIGTAYDAKAELKKHYSRVSLPLQFDEYIWFDETSAVKPLKQ